MKELNVHGAVGDRAQVVAEFQQEVFIMASLEHLSIFLPNLFFLPLSYFYERNTLTFGK